MMGESAFYRAKGAEEETPPIEIMGVPGSELLELFSGAGAPSKSQRLILGVSLTRLKALGIQPKEGDSILLRETGFRIRDVEPDNEGGASLVLKKG